MIGLAANTALNAANPTLTIAKTFEIVPKQVVRAVNPAWSLVITPTAAEAPDSAANPAAIGTISGHNACSNGESTRIAPIKAPPKIGISGLIAASNEVTTGAAPWIAAVSTEPISAANCAITGASAAITPAKGLNAGNRFVTIC